MRELDFIPLACNVVLHHVDKPYQCLVLKTTLCVGSPYPELRAYVSLVIEVLDYLYINTRTLVPNALSTFSTDLTVKTDGRRFLFEYGKSEQLK